MNPVVMVTTPACSRSHVCCKMMLLAFQNERQLSVRVCFLLLKCEAEVAGTVLDFVLGLQVVHALC